MRRPPPTAMIPFVIVGTVGVAALAAPLHSLDGPHLAVVLGLLAANVAYGVRVALRTEPSWRDGVPPLAFFLVIAALRDATASATPTVPLLALPTLWIALYGTRRQLVLAGAATIAVLVVPMALIGSPRYPVSDWRRAVVWTLIVFLICPVIQRVVNRLDEERSRQERVSSHLDGVLRAATEHAIVASDLEGRITFFNEGAERMLGWKAEEVVGLRTPEVWHDQAELDRIALEEGVDRAEVVVHRAKREGRDTREWTYVSRDGHRSTVRLTITGMYDASGTLVGWMGVAVDVTVEQQALRALRESEQRWRALLDHLPDTAVMVIGPDLRFRLATGLGLQRQGVANAQGLTLADIASPENVARIEPVLRGALGGREGQVEVLATHTGRVLQIVGTPLPPRDDEPEALVVAWDVTEERAREESERRARQLFQRIFDEAPYGVALVGLDGIVQQVNPALCQMLGTPREDMVGRPLETFRPPDSDAPQGVIQVLLDSPTGRLELEMYLPRPDGQLVRVAIGGVVLRGPDGVAESVLFNIVDISERHRYEEQLSYLADHDPLTGLANRRQFDAALTAHMERCRRTGPAGALMVLDLDHFKQINDTLGHLAGDQLIMAAGAALRARAGGNDLVARLGGDEFALLLPDADREGATALARDLVRLVRDQVRVRSGGRERRVTTSIGVVLVTDAGTSSSELLSAADMAMYDAKEEGRDGFSVFGGVDAEHPGTAGRLAWVDRLSEALETDRFVLYAQPILDLRSGRVSGAELLVRMLDEDGQPVSPAQFIPAAERAGLIQQLDRWVLDRAVDVLSDAQHIDPTFRVQVNLSGHSVGNQMVIHDLLRHLSQRPFDPQCLVLEITETVAVADLDSAVQFGRDVQAMGFRFALDDFGAGFGSFKYLKHLVFDFIKVDGDFVVDAPSNPTDRLILASIVGLAHGLGKETVAEYVEDEQVLQIVRSLGIDHAQGHHVGEPEPVEDLLRRLARGEAFPGKGVRAARP
ncbi:MAG: EAL domain-containing protein [Oryzihumus sp.]